MKKSVLITLFMFLLLSFLIFTGCKDPEVPHSHTFADSWTSDATHHWKAVTCEHTEEVSEKAGHSFGNWTTTKEPTEETTGSKKRVCSVCKYEETAEIAKLAHTHKFATDWTYDGTNHWKVATCEHTEEVSEKTGHSFGNWTTTKEPTEETTGSKKRVCSVCKYEETAEIAKLVHTFGEYVSNNDATTEADGTKTRECSVCGYKETVTDDGSKIHVHSYSTDWTYDGTNHWKAATCEHAEEVSEKSAHTFGEYVSNNDATTEADGTKTRECGVCGYEDTVVDEGTKIIAIYSVELETTTIGETYTGRIPVKIYGANLLAYKITSRDSNISDVNYVSNTEATAKLKINNSVGSHLVTINCGTASGSTVYNVIEAEKCFSVGDILFTDGTRIKSEDVQYGVPDEKISKALGVITATTYGGGVGKAVGLHHGEDLEWAPYGTTGYETNFREIQGTTIDGDMDGSDNWEYICSVDPTGTVDAATNYPAFNFANTYGTTAGLTGTDYEDGWYLPTIAELYDIYTNRYILIELLSAVGGIDTIGNYYYWSSSQCSVSGKPCSYELYFFDDTMNKMSRDYSNNVLVLHTFNCEQFNNYEIETNITSIKVASAGEGYTGNLLVTIEGTKLKDQNITCDDETFSNLTYISNKFATATITCNGTVGTSYITVTCGSSSRTGIVKVLSSANCFTSENIGDIVLSDGSFVTKDNFNSSTMTPIAVVVGVKNNGGQAVAVGLQKGTSLQWAPSGTTGYNTNFTEIQGTKTSGDMDGSDNWDYICSVDPEGTADAATNYPAFNFANNYGTTADLTDTDYKNGWYLPSIAELYQIYENRSVIQEGLTATGGFTIVTSYYWSSSQDSVSNAAYRLGFDGGDVSNSIKDNEYSNTNVLVVQAFNAQ